MKHLIRNILIILFCLTTIPFWRRVFLRSREPGSRLLRAWCLHEVKDNQIKQFEKKIKYLKEKYNIITHQQFIYQDFSKDKLNILITFDDGFENWFDNVLPILKKHNIKAIFFINKEFQYLRNISNGKFFYNEKLEDYINNILADGHSIGGHSFTHQRLTDLDQEEIHKEIWQSVKSEFFAYPFGDRGSYNKQIINIVKEAGYKYAFTILPGFNNKKTDPYALHRDALDPDVNDLIFKLWFKGCYDWKV